MVQVKVKFFEVLAINDPKVIEAYLIDKGIDPTKPVTFAEDLENEQFIITQN